jgi:hypothetical protein
MLITSQPPLSRVGLAQSVQRWAMGWMVGVRFAAGTGDYSLPHSVQTDIEAHPDSYPIDTAGSFPGVKAAGGVKMTTSLHLVSRLKMVALYLRSSTTDR